VKKKVIAVCSKLNLCVELKVIERGLNNLDLRNFVIY